jgi:hypothetical protein
MKMLPGSTSSEATFSTISDWLREYETKHHDCVRQSPGQTSSRLNGIKFLEIQEDRVLLVEPTDRLHPAFYACLSHCWGSGEDMVRTTKENIHVHSTRGIEIALLPLTLGMP